MGGFTNMIIPAMKKWEFIPSYGDRMRFLWGIASGNLLQFANLNIPHLVRWFSYSKWRFPVRKLLVYQRLPKGLCSLLDLQMDDGTNTWFVSTKRCYFSWLRYTLFAGKSSSLFVKITHTCWLKVRIVVGQTADFMNTGTFLLVKSPFFEVKITILVGFSALFSESTSRWVGRRRPACPNQRVRASTQKRPPISIAKLEKSVVMTIFYPHISMYIYIYISINVPWWSYCCWIVYTVLGK